MGLLVLTMYSVFQGGQVYHGQHPVELFLPAMFSTSLHGGAIPFNPFTSRNRTPTALTSAISSTGSIGPPEERLALSG